MNLPPRLADDPAAYVRPSARVARVAELLDCDPGDIRRLIATGHLEAHGKGTRGVRVFLDSVKAYQDGRPVVPKAIRPQVRPPKPKAPASTAAYRAAMAGLRSKGIA